MSNLQAVLGFAQAQLGQPYLWGGEGAGGFDCSGLTQAAYKAGGVALPRTAQEQYDATARVATPATGDLIFYGDSPSNVTHVGLYLGGAKMLDAPHTGALVRVENVWSGVVGYGRPITGQTAADPSLGSGTPAADTSSSGSTSSSSGGIAGTLKRLTVEGVFVAGGAGLLVLGLWKGTTAGRKVSKSVTDLKNQASSPDHDVAGGGAAAPPGEGPAAAESGAVKGAGGAAAGGSKLGTLAEAAAV